MPTPIAGAVRMLTILTVLVLGTVAAARADTTMLNGTDAPLIRIENATGNVTVRTWDRPSVRVDADPGAVTIDRSSASVPVSTLPILAGRVVGPQGLVTLPVETFAVSTLGPQVRDVVRISGRDTGPIVVTMPNATALLVVQTTHGAVAIHQYTGGTIVARVQQGRVRLDRDGGSAFVQVMRGPVLVNDSNFDRIRSRTALGVTVYERCRARQIEATSVSGAIVYDRGSFDPGLARFQSESGPVAIGVDGAAQLGGRGGHVYTAFAQRVGLSNRGDAGASASAVVGGGGPQVTAASATGNVYFYDGSLRDRPNLGGEWSPVSDVMRAVPTRPGAAVESVPFAAPRPHVDRPLREPQQRPYVPRVSRPRERRFMKREPMLVRRAGRRS